MRSSYAAQSRVAPADTLTLKLTIKAEVGIRSKWKCVPTAINAWVFIGVGWRVWGAPSRRWRGARRATGSRYAISVVDGLQCTDAKVELYCALGPLMGPNSDMNSVQFVTDRQYTNTSKSALWVFKLFPSL